MLQRIQSILLLLAATAVFALFKLPFGSTSEGIANSILFNDRFFNIQDHIGLLAVFCGAGALAFIAIFLFKNRSLQMTLSRIAIIANIIGMVLAVILFMQDSQTLGDALPKEEFGLGLPVLSIIFTAFALRFIKKDENLVKSMDRLR